VPSADGNGKVALVTGGGRGIGANVARALAADGWSVVVAARSRDQIEDVAAEIGGRAVELDVASRESVERAVAEAGPVELLVANAGTGNRDVSWEIDPAEWWRTFEVNVLGVHLCCVAVIPGMLERGSGRIVITGSGASYLPGATATAYPASKAAVGRYAETLNNELEGRVPVFLISPGLVRTEMTDGWFPDDAPWTPPELAPELVRKLASGRYDALAGRYLHAEHDDVDDLLARIDEVRERDLNAIRLRREA
jgi:3-oxoacyl-[acyl-carrier protein] reductase